MNIKTKQNKINKNRIGSIKKLFFIYFLIFCVLSLASIGNAAAEPSVSVIPASTIEQSPGDTFNISIHIDSANYNLRACRLDLIYNSSALTVISVIDRNLLGERILHSPDTCYVCDGEISHGLARRRGNPSAPVSGTFITVNFEVNSEAANKTYLLQLSDVILLDENHDYILNFTVNNGSVIVGGGNTKTNIDNSKTGYGNT